MQDFRTESLLLNSEKPQLEILRGFKALLPVGLISLLGSLLGEWFKNNYILEPRQHFIIEASTLFLDAYVLNYSVHWFLNKKMEGQANFKSPNLFSCLANPLISLPKVFLSYFLLLVCTQVSLNFFEASPFPILFLLVFFIWAPYIVGYEYFSKPMPEEELEDDFDIFDESSSFPPQKLFMGKASWRIGFNRSIDFATKNLSLSVALVFAIWIGKVFPEFISLLFGDPMVDFKVIVVQKLLEWTSDMYLHSYIVWVLFSRLEPEERDELTIEKREIPAKVSLTYTPPFGLRMPVLAVIVLSVTILWSERKVQLGGIPNGEKIEIREVKIGEGEIVFKLEVQDEKSKLRWFRPERIRLLENPSTVVNLEKGENKPAATLPEETIPETKETKKDVSERSLEMLLLKREELVEASRIKISTSNGEAIETYQISPRSDALEVLIAFPIKKRASTAIPAVYELSYLSILGFKDPIYTFSDTSQP